MEETPKELVDRFFEKSDNDPVKVIQSLYWVASPKGWENHEGHCMEVAELVFERIRQGILDKI